MPKESAIDTTVLQKANAPITQPPREKRLFRKRIKLLSEIQAGRRTALISKQLLAEYVRKLPSPRNDYVKLFLELMANPDQNRCIFNCARWPGRDREKARKCRYPKHDDHVLCTAILPDSRTSTIITEEDRMLKADACIYREFRVHIIHTQDI